MHIRVLALKEHHLQRHSHLLQMVLRVFIVKVHVLFDKTIEQYHNAVLVTMTNKYVV